MCHARGTMLCSSGLKSAKGWAYETPTSRSAAAPARIAANASLGPPQAPTFSTRRRSGGATGSDVGGASADELGNVPGGHDHGVHPGALELGHIVAATDCELRDRELSCRHVFEEVERALQRPLVAALASRQQEDLGVEPLEGRLELLLVTSLEGALEAQVERVAVGLLELPVLVFELREREHAGVRLGRTRELGRAVRPPQQRQARRLPDQVDRLMKGERLGALLLGGARGSRAVNGHHD